MKNVFRNVANVLGISESNLWFSIDGERITEGYLHFAFFRTFFFFIILLYGIL